MSKVECPALAGNTHLSPLRLARASALLKDIEARGYINLTDSEYRQLREYGFNRRAVDRAINDLARLELVELTSRAYQVSIRLIIKNEREVAK
jgi:hypothetical protein